jgi:hypothetical protein
VILNWLVILQARFCKWVNPSIFSLPFQLFISSLQHFNILCFLPFITFITNMTKVSMNTQQSSILRNMLCMLINMVPADNQEVAREICVRATNSVFVNFELENEAEAVARAMANWDSDESDEDNDNPQDMDYDVNNDSDSESVDDDLGAQDRLAELFESSDEEDESMDDESEIGYSTDDAYSIAAISDSESIMSEGEFEFDPIEVAPRVRAGIDTDDNTMMNLFDEMHQDLLPDFIEMPTYVIPTTLAQIPRAFSACVTSIGVIRMESIAVRYNIGYIMDTHKRLWEAAHPNESWINIAKPLFNYEESTIRLYLRLYKIIFKYPQLLRLPKSLRWFFIHMSQLETIPSNRSQHAFWSQPLTINID